MFKIVIFLMLFMCLSVAPSFAVSLKWSEDYALKDNMSVLYTPGSTANVGTAGLFVGTIGEVRLASGKKMLGLGGFNFNLSESGHPIFAVVPATFFDDLIQVGVAVSPDNFKWNNPDSYMLSVGISATALANRVWK